MRDQRDNFGYEYFQEDSEFDWVILEEADTIVLDDDAGKYVPLPGDFPFYENRNKGFPHPPVGLACAVVTIHSHETATLPTSKCLGSYEIVIFWLILTKVRTTKKTTISMIRRDFAIINQSYRHPVPINRLL